MRRREFLGLAGSALAVWPLRVWAQQPDRLRRIGVLSAGVAEAPENKDRIAAFLLGLRELGWTDGHNVQIVYRWFGGSAADARKYASELAALAPDVVLATGSAGTGPMLEATRTVPIVFVILPDPVGSGLVKGLSRPGGNATGFMMFEYNLCGKWLELLKQIAPRVTRAAVLRDPAIEAGIGAVRRNPVRGTVGWRRGEPSQPKRRGRDRARSRCLRGLREWRSGLDGECVVAISS